MLFFNIAKRPLKINVLKSQPCAPFVITKLILFIPLFSEYIFDRLVIARRHMTFLQFKQYRV